MTDFHITDIITGTGKSAERGALITAHYIGTLADGTVDSSHSRGAPFECVIGTPNQNAKTTPGNTA
ncbi:FKBP-type peptidyl-prolyl cis-trans isomerase [Moraxella canis]|nr:FKBP-type peptidyl-prolyl cis-trans isomerase [Moraxella canis]